MKMLETSTASVFAGLKLIINLSAHSFNFLDSYLVQFLFELIQMMSARKPVLGGLRTTQAQISLRIRTIRSEHLLFAFRKVSYVDFLQMRFQFSS